VFDSKSSDGTGALLFALLMLLIAAVSFTVAIICGGIYSTVSSLWNFANKNFTKGVLWAGPALLVGNAFLIHPADETWARLCIGWLIAIPIAGAVDLVRTMRSNTEPKLSAPEYQNLESRQRLIAKM
jgi:urea transporter